MLTRRRTRDPSTSVNDTPCCCLVAALLLTAAWFGMLALAPAPALIFCFCANLPLLFLWLNLWLYFPCAQSRQNEWPAMAPPQALQQ